ncbi:MAG: hypothetical protein HY033_06565 [Ignavibacteriae bacterium]|nr:hypothetical protein [Ignavibacteria bacterium]MBI3364554.1 hypothetical protein [Ignavibacteriota bacterium]
MREKKIAFVTSIDYPELTDDDRIASQALRSEGVRIVPVVWNEPSTEWAEFDVVVVRSCWDYHRAPDAFRSWIDSMEEHDVRIWNPPNILRWNMEKTYLCDIEKRGIAIPRTIFLNDTDSFDARSIIDRIGTSDVVIKPAISASAWRTWRCSLINFSSDDRNRLDELSRQSNIMVQEFMPEIIKDGEWSFIFFGDRFSHAVRKYPGSKDFRVQKEHGGRYHPIQNLPVPLVQEAEKIITTIEEPILYARVDGIEREGKLILMELELIEPQLFFDSHPDAVKRFMEQLRLLAFG